MGLFIVFEGIEGCGKSTQIELLAAELQRRQMAVTCTREPGGTAIGEQIRGIFLHSDHVRMLPLTELLLVVAARVQHVHEVIRPALEADGVVLCDRFCDATAVYQGFAGGVPQDVVDACHQQFLDDLLPDMTIVLDCSVDVGLARSRGRNAARGIALTEGRFEDKERAFHEQVRAGYLERARRWPDRFRVIDADHPVAAVQEQVRAGVDALLRERRHAV